MNRLKQRPLWHRAVGLVVSLVVFYFTQSLFAASAEGLFIAANAFQTTDWLAMKCLDLLLNKLAIAAHFDTSQNKEFTKAFAVDDSVRFKKPQRFTIRRGLQYTPQPINRQTVTVDLGQPFGIDFEWDSYEAAVKLERSEAELENNYLEPAMAQMAQEIESQAAEFAALNTNNIVGQLGTDPVDFDTTSAAARARMVELGCPAGGEKGIFVAPQVMRALKKSSISYFNPVTDIAKQFRTGIAGSGDSFDWYESVSLYNHTAGTWAGVVEILAAPVDGATTLSLTATTGDVFFAGDVFNIVGVNQVNTMTRKKLNTVKKQFRIVANVVAAASAATITITPAIYGPGSQYQNVDALPVAGADLTLFPGTTTPNGLSGVNGLAFHDQAFALVGVELEKPKGSSVEVAVQQRDPETGIAIRFIRQFDGTSSKMINRFDALIGFGALYPDECSVRILGA